MEGKSNPNVVAIRTRVSRVLDGLSNQGLSEYDFVVIELILLG